MPRRREITSIVGGRGEKDKDDFTKYGWMGFDKDSNPIQPIFVTAQACRCEAGFCFSR